jgi:hypothetical protein
MVLAGDAPSPRALCLLAHLSMATLPTFRSFSSNAALSDFAVLATRFVDGKMVVDNGGLHGAEERCGIEELEPGVHKMYVDFFDKDWGATMEMSYAGPDTGNVKVPVPSVSAQGPQPKNASRWGMRVFESDSDVTENYDLSLMRLVGTAMTPVVDFDRLTDLQAFVPATPQNKYAVQFYGSVDIEMAGTYTFCLESKDGSRIYIGDNSQPTVENWGEHNSKTKCGMVQLSAGRHKTRIDYYCNQNAPEIKATYAGPQTGGSKMRLHSDDPAMPPIGAPSRWLMRVWGAVNDEPITDQPQDMAFMVYKGESVLPAADIYSAAVIKEYVPAAPTNYFNAIFYGKKTIKEAGTYRFCLKSYGMAHLYVDDKAVVSDGETYHGVNVKCGTLFLTAGAHNVNVDWFRRNHGNDLHLTWSGADTGGNAFVMGSELRKNVPLPGASTWIVRAFSGLLDLRDVPLDMKENDKFRGEATLQMIDFDNKNEFESAFPGLEGQTKFSVSAHGKRTVISGGVYKFCTKSDRGDYLFVDGELVVDNGGWHGLRTKCGTKQLAPGSHDFVGHYYSNQGTARYEISWEGPDTGNNEMKLGSDAMPSDLPATVRSAPGPGRFRFLSLSRDPASFGKWLPEQACRCVNPKCR